MIIWYPQLLHRRFRKYNCFIRTYKRQTDARTTPPPCACPRYRKKICLNFFPVKYPHLRRRRSPLLVGANVTDRDTSVLYPNIKRPWQHSRSSKNDKIIKCYKRKIYKEKNLQKKTLLTSRVHNSWKCNADNSFLCPYISRPSSLPVRCDGTFEDNDGHFVEAALFGVTEQIAVGDDEWWYTSM